MLEEAVKGFGSVDILVNNAGAYEYIPLEEITNDHFHRLFRTILVTQAALPHPRKTGGSVINISSVVSVWVC
jgi:3-oxoacyl-[acyl-carrier protein] reductase